MIKNKLITILSHIYFGHAVPVTTLLIISFLNQGLQSKDYIIIAGVNFASAVLCLILDWRYSSEKGKKFPIIIDLVAFTVKICICVLFLDALSVLLIAGVDLVWLILGFAIRIRTKKVAGHNEVKPRLSVRFISHIVFGVPFHIFQYYAVSLMVENDEAKWDHYSGDYRFSIEARWREFAAKFSDMQYIAGNILIIQLILNCLLLLISDCLICYYFGNNKKFFFTSVIIILLALRGLFLFVVGCLARDIRYGLIVNILEMIYIMGITSLTNKGYYTRYPEAKFK